ncbi:MAG: YabP/YqfC family sporulation protein [Clostridia bacterium]
MRKTKNRKKQNRLEELLEIPKEISSQEAKITVVGFEQMLIENYKGILEYQEFYIRISTHIGIVNINGFNLKLEEMTTDDIMVTGKIESIDFENRVDEGEGLCT